MELKINTDYIIQDKPKKSYEYYDKYHVNRIKVLELTKTSMLYKAGNYEHRVLLTEFHNNFNIIEEIEEPEFLLIHGFNTHEELAAYEKGREEESNTIQQFIQNWDGNDNSQLGALINSKIEQFLI